MVDPRERDILRAIWEHGRLSRAELHQRVGLTANRVGELAGGLVEAGLLREGPPEVEGRGRPRVPLELDPDRRWVLGVALEPGAAELAALSLRGQLLGRPVRRRVSDPSKRVAAVAELLAGADRRQQAVAVGLSVTGFVDPQQREVLLSSAVGDGGAMSLAPIYDAADPLPMVLGNDVHALAARWLLTHRADEHEDVLLVRLEDGRLGGGLLVGGRPNRGCVTASNELGHTRFFTDTERCYCGQTGCLERIVSTDFLRRRDGQTGPTLTERAERWDEHEDPALAEVIEYLACGLANAMNFVRPHRLVLVSSLCRFPALMDRLLRRTRAGVLREVVERTRIDLWDEPAAAPAETAAWLAMAELIYGGWEEKR